MQENDHNKWYWSECRLAAEAGDHASAIDIIEATRNALEDGTPLNDDARAFMVRALTEILTGAPPKDALRLTKLAHRESGKNLDRDVALAAATILYQRRGDSPKTALSNVALDLGPRWGLKENSDKTVERALKAYRDELERKDDDFLIQLAFAKPSRQKV